jgi:hypothetical protein
MKTYPRNSLPMMLAAFALSFFRVEATTGSSTKAGGLHDVNG